ncbi:MAG: hypothetical protein WBP45_09510 [Daejeonella sp.]
MIVLDFVVIDFGLLLATAVIVLLVFLFGLILLISSYKNKQRRKIAYLLIFLPILFVLCYIIPIWRDNNKRKLQEEKVRDLTKNGVVFTARLSSWPTDENNYCIPLNKDSTKICLLLDSTLYDHGEYILGAGYKIVYLNSLYDAKLDVKLNAKLMGYSVEDLKIKNKEVWVTLRVRGCPGSCLYLLELIKIEERQVKASTKIDTIIKNDYVN